MPFFYSRGLRNPKSDPSHSILCTKLTAPSRRAPTRGSGKHWRSEGVFSNMETPQLKKTQGRLRWTPPKPETKRTTTTTTGLESKARCRTPEAARPRLSDGRATQFQPEWCRSLGLGFRVIRMLVIPVCLALAGTTLLQRLSDDAEKYGLGC